MTNKSDRMNTLVENQQLRAALAHMSEAELKRLLNSIGALQIDLSRLVPIVTRAESIEVVTATQSLLKTLSAEIRNIFAVKRAKDSRDRLQNWDNEGGSVDYVPVYHLLSKVHGGKRCLIWTDSGPVRR